MALIPRVHKLRTQNPMGIDGGITRSQPTVRLDRPWDSHDFTFPFHEFSSLLKVYVDNLLAEHTKEARSSGLQGNPQVVSIKLLP